MHLLKLFAAMAIIGISITLMSTDTMYAKEPVDSKPLTPADVEAIFKREATKIREAAITFAKTLKSRTLRELVLKKADQLADWTASTDEEPVLFFADLNAKDVLFVKFNAQVHPHYREAGIDEVASIFDLDDLPRMYRTVMIDAGRVHVFKGHSSIPPALTIRAAEILRYDLFSNAEGKKEFLAAMDSAGLMTILWKRMVAQAKANDKNKTTLPKVKKYFESLDESEPKKEQPEKK